MLKFGNQEFRNLEEQVLKNQQDIQDFKDGNQTIAEFGITVVGILSSADQLPASGDNFGDAYLIGTETPYDMRVWTRNIPEQRAMEVSRRGTEQGDSFETQAIRLLYQQSLGTAEAEQSAWCHGRL